MTDRVLSLGRAALAAGLLLSATAARAQITSPPTGPGNQVPPVAPGIEPIPELREGQPGVYVPLAVPGQAAAGPLPRVSMAGHGPTAYPVRRAFGPSYPFHEGLYYYGTNPGNDDWVNGLCDCADGNCGRLAYAIMTRWELRHKRHNIGPVSRAVQAAQRHFPAQIHGQPGCDCVPTMERFTGPGPAHGHQAGRP